MFYTPPIGYLLNKQVVLRSYTRKGAVIVHTSRLWEGAASLPERSNVLRTSTECGPEGLYVKRCYCTRYRFSKLGCLMAERSNALRKRRL